MKFRFLHCADIHLGYQQYGQKERFNDFGRAFYAIVDKALGKPTRFDPNIQGPVDFVLLAGDLFHRRSIDALTLNQAIRGLKRLRDEGIPCIAVEGNHERAYYEDTIGWMKFLALQDLLVLLDAPFADGKAQFQAWDPVRRQGSYIEPKPGVRVHGLRYVGSGTAAAVRAYAEGLADLMADRSTFNIFMAHAGLEGKLDEKAGGLSSRQWSPLRPHVDYLALGHFHKPFQVDGWIYNPGSPENCSVAEAAWPERGYLLVEVDSDRQTPDGRRHWVNAGNNPRRACRVYTYKTDHAVSPEDLLEHLREFMRRKATELRDSLASRTATEFGPPVVELYLTGVLPFERGSLELSAVEQIVVEAFSPLVAVVKNLAQGREYAVDTGEALSRAELEMQVLTDLFARDQRYAAQPQSWARLAITLKQMTLSDAAPDGILEELAAHLGQIEEETPIHARVEQ